MYVFHLFRIFFFVKGPTHIKRATTEKLRETFLKYATHQHNGEYYMTAEDFIRGYLRLFPEANYNKVNVHFGFRSSEVLKTASMNRIR